MKHREVEYRVADAGSLPSRERELKPGGIFFARGSRLVAPLAGARIETSRLLSQDANMDVAPLAGARIETRSVIGRLISPQSLPSRERELKHIDSALLLVEVKSLPSREHELKRYQDL